MTAIQKRYMTLLFAGVAVIILIVLAAGLSGIELESARPVTTQREPELQPGVPALAQDPFAIRGFFQVMGLIFAILTPFAIIHFILSPDARKRVIRQALIFSLIAVALFIAIRNIRPQFDMEPGTLSDFDSGAQFVAPGEGVLNPPPFIVFLVGLIFVGTVVFFGWRMMQNLQQDDDPLEELANEARDALEDLRAGANLRDTVMRCYYEMSRILMQRRGLKRHRAMTAREFTSYLEQAGLHSEHVQRLTRLFEGTRYGDKTPGEQEEREARACLEAIAQTYGGAA